MSSLLAIIVAVGCTSPPTGPQSTSGQVTDPGQVTDLIVTDSTGTAATLSFTQVDDGAGNPADYAVRTHIGPMNWGAAEEVSQGTCAAPLQGTAIGSTMSCTIEGLLPDVTYTFQVAAFRGTFQAGAVYGELSNVVPDMGDESDQSPPSNGSHPNEPAGFSTIAAVDFTDGANAQVGACGEHSDPWKQSNSEYLTDGSAPTGSGSVFRGRFPKGMDDGGASWRFDCWGPTMGEKGANDHDEVYISFWLMIEGDDFENQTVGTKIFYMAYGSTNRTNHSTMTMGGVGKQAIMSEMPVFYWISQMRSDGSDPGGGAVKHWANVNERKFRAGQWHHVEAYYRINDIDPTTDNGEIKIWLDGVQTHEIEGLRFRSDENPLSFYHVQFTPVYGGHSGDVRTRDDYWRIDNVHISAR